CQAAGAGRTCARPRHCRTKWAALGRWLPRRGGAQRCAPWPVAADEAGTTWMVAVHPRKYSPGGRRSRPEAGGQRPAVQTPPGAWAGGGLAAPGAGRHYSPPLPHNGRVLFGGGLTGPRPAQGPCAVGYDALRPASGTSTTTGSMGTARAFHTLTVMLNGQMLA